MTETAVMDLVRSNLVAKAKAEADRLVGGPDTAIQVGLVLGLCLAVNQIDEHFEKQDAYS